jgi:hypothetical protein
MLTKSSKKTEKNLQQEKVAENEPDKILCDIGILLKELDKKYGSS